VHASYIPSPPKAFVDGGLSVAVVVGEAVGEAVAVRVGAAVAVAVGGEVGVGVAIFVGAGVAVGLAGTKGVMVGIGGAVGVVDVVIVNVACAWAAPEISTVTVCGPKTDAGTVNEAANCPQWLAWKVASAAEPSHTREPESPRRFRPTLPDAWDTVPDDPDAGESVIDEAEAVPCNCRDAMTVTVPESAIAITPTMRLITACTPSATGLQDQPLPPRFNRQPGQLCELRGFASPPRGGFAFFDLDSS
jgi:hypothetical protein